MGKNILEVCLSPDLGGLELFSVHCYNSYKKYNNVKIAVAPQKKLDKYLDSKDKIHIKRNKLFPIIPALLLAKEIDKYKIDVVHFHWTRDIMSVVLAKLLSKRNPTLIQSRHMEMTRFKDDIYHRWLYKNITKIHAVTKLVKEQLIKYIPSSIRPEIELVYLGVKVKSAIDSSALQERYNILKSDFVVAIIGRIQAGKDQHIVIEAIGKLKDLSIKLFIVGESMDAEYLAQLHTICSDLEIENRVIFTGFSRDVDSYMSMCDTTILATKNETFGLVIIESMAHSTPVIATDRGGPLEIIDDKVDGLLYDGTSKDLATKIELLYRDRALKDELSINALKKVQEKFYFDKQLDKLYEIITRE